MFNDFIIMSDSNLNGDSDDRDAANHRQPRRTERHHIPILHVSPRPARHIRRVHHMPRFERHVSTFAQQYLFKCWLRTGG